MTTIFVAFIASKIVAFVHENRVAHPRKKWHHHENRGQFHENRVSNINII